MNNVQMLSIVIIIAAVAVSGYFLLDSAKSDNQTAGGLAPVVDGKQVMQMAVKAISYSPNSFRVKAGVPVRWEITSSGEPGCDSGVLIARGLFDPVYLNPNQGQVTVKEFTPQNAGKYTFSCPMGMVRGSIEVIN